MGDLHLFRRSVGGIMLKELEKSTNMILSAACTSFQVRVGTLKQVGDGVFNSNVGALGKLQYCDCLLHTQ